MRNEVAPKVLSVIDEYLTNKGKKNIYTVLESLGVRDINDKVFDYVWEVPTGVPIFTIWAERVAVHPVSGQMFYVENLAERTTLPGGAAMSAAQIQRTNNRRRLMGQVRNGQLFIAILQTNEQSKEDLMRNVVAKPHQRIKDSPWHVARWDETHERAILVRGESKWAPTDVEVEQFLQQGRIDVPTGLNGNGDSQHDKKGVAKIQLRFPDQAHRDRVEAVSMAMVEAEFIKQGLNPVDVSSENRGYDLDVQNAAGVSVWHVEVKGTSAKFPGFFITSNERNKSGSDPLWELAVVTDALVDPEIERYTAREMEKFFGFEPLVWRCDLKPR